MLEELYEKKYLNIEKLLFDYFNILNISENELLVLLSLIKIKDETKNNFKIVDLKKQLHLDFNIISDCFNNLLMKDFINIKIEYNKSGKKREIYSLTPLFNKLETLIENEKYEKNKVVNEDNINKILSLFEIEFNRSLTPMELDIIRTWDKEGFSYEDINNALKKAVKNGVRTFKYIDSILISLKESNNNINSETHKIIGELFEKVK